jgi:hypothetical protein
MDVALQARNALAVFRNLKSKDLHASASGSWTDHADSTTAWNPSKDGQKASKRNQGFAHGTASRRNDSGA